MSLVGFRPASSPGRHCLVLVIRRALAKTSGLAVPGGMRAQHARDPRPEWCGISMELRLMRKRGCAQCAHSGRRTGSYIGRIGPDSVRFRGSPVFTRAGMQFESHLGHA